MMALRVHVWMQLKWELDDVWASRQEGKHQLALIHNTQLLILDTGSRTAGYTDVCYASISGRQSTLIKSKVIKGILTQSLPNCCHFLAAACGQTAHILRDIVRMERGWRERGAALPPARWSPPNQTGREMVHAMATRNHNHTAQEQADDQAFSLISSTRQYEGVSKWFLWKDRLFLKWPWSQTGPSCMYIYGSLQVETWRSFFHPNTIWYHWKCEVHQDNNNLDYLIFGQLV